MQSLSQLYKYRALVQILVQRELKARYRGTFFGFLWSFLNPLILMVTYTIVFSVYMKITDIQNYPVFLLCGILPWTWFSSAISDSTTAILRNSGLIKKVYLPSEIFPVIYTTSNMIHYILSLPILFLFLVLANFTPTPYILVLPIVVAIQFIFILSLSLILSALAVQFRDLIHIIPNIIMIWFFFTPIFYPMKLIPENYQIYVMLNPMTQLVLAYQNILLYGTPPFLVGLGGLFVGSCIMLVLGFLFFQSRKDIFAEEI